MADHVGKQCSELCQTVRYHMYTFRTGQQSPPAGPGMPVEQPADSAPQMSNFPTQRVMVNDNISMGATNKPDYR